MRIAAAIMSLACLTPGAAWAQCAQLKLLNEVALQSAGPGAMTVPVDVNGTQQAWAFSTSAVTTQISRDLAKSLSLEVKQAQTELFDEDGKPWRDVVTLKLLSLGTFENNNFTLPVSPSATLKSGALSLNFLRPFDVDADFAGRKLRFFSQDHCPGQVLYWKAAVAGAAPMTVADGRITVPVVLDGKAITGVIDTSAPFTRVRTAVAERTLGLDLGGPDTPLNSGAGQSYTHTYAALSIGNVALKTVAMRISSDVSVRAASGAGQAAVRAAIARVEMNDPVVTIGMDVLSRLHIYMAFKENKLYLTPAADVSATQ